MRSKTVLTLTVVASMLCMVAVGVEAQRGRRGRRGRQAAAAPAAPPNSAAIAEALGELHWGMEPRQVHQYFVQQIQRRYRPRLAKAPGSIEEDRLRREMDDEVRRLRESYVRFEGVRTGWDLSFLRGEFTHGNQESMLVYRDENSQNFYFFIGGRLWKWYKAFDASVFQGQAFEQFAGAVQGRFGQAAERSGRLIESGPQQRWLEWQDSATRLRAIDQTHFYGFYCLVFEDKGVLDRIDTLRTHTVAAAGQGGHALVDSVILPEDGDTGSHSEGNADIADRITGRVRRVQQAPTKASGGAAAGSGSSGSGSSGSGSSGSGSSDSSSGSSRRGSGHGDSLDLSDL